MIPITEIESVLAKLDPKTRARVQSAQDIKIEKQLTPSIGLNFALDVVAQNNKLAAKLAQQYTPMIMGLVPIPEASTVGIIIGYMISTMFIFF